MRALERLEQLYAIGGGPGANRIGYSPEEDEAHALARGWLEEAGLEVEVDEAGNLFGTSGRRGPASGRARTSTPCRRAGSSTARSAWSPRSRRSSGPAAGRSWSSATRSAGAPVSQAFVARGQLPDAFLELHIEQGPRLADAGAPLGIVTAIVGYVRGEVVGRGRGRARRERRRWQCATTRSSRRPSSMLRFRDEAACDRGRRARRSAGSRPSRAA